MFIKKIYDYASTVRENLVELENRGVGEEGLEDERLKMALLRKALTFVYQGSWLKKESARKRLKTIMDARFDYASVANELVNTNGSLEKKVNSLRSFMTFVSTMVDEKFKTGETFLALLESNQLVEAHMRYYIVSGEVSTSSLLLDGVIRELPSAQPSALLRLQDCKAELENLQNLSVYYFKSHILPSLESKKLAFLLDILESDDPARIHERVALCRYLMGDFKDVDTLLFYLDENYDKA